MVYSSEKPVAVGLPASFLEHSRAGEAPAELQQDGAAAKQARTRHWCGT
jgi:hypothetical protein